MTVHRSKGLQAKVVFILNVRDDMYGFPCGIVDSRIYDPAIIGRKKDRIEEERRLFLCGSDQGERRSNNLFLGIIKKSIYKRNITAS